MKYPNLRKIKDKFQKTDKIVCAIVIIMIFFIIIIIIKDIISCNRELDESTSDSIIIENIATGDILTTGTEVIITTEIIPSISQTIHQNIIPTALITETPSNVSESNSFVGNLTAYCGCQKCCGKYSTGNSIVYGAYGTELISGYTCASDYFPEGTILYIQDFGQVEVRDVFGAGHGRSSLDIYFDSHEVALAFGRQKRMVEIIS